MPSLDTRGTSSAEGTALETHACWVIAHGWSSAASPWRGTVEARPLRAKTPPSSDPPFSAATSHWAQDRPANGSGGIRRAPVLGVMGAMDGRDAEIAQLWPWRGFDRLVAKKDISHVQGTFTVYRVHGPNGACTVQCFWRRGHPRHALAQVKLSRSRIPSVRLDPFPTPYPMVPQEHIHIHLDTTVIDTTPVHPVKYGTVNTGTMYAS